MSFPLALLAFVLCLSPFEAFAARDGKQQKLKGPKGEIRSEAGLNIPEWGIAIDAFFDPRLTELVSGYHVVNIVLTNRRASPITLNPRGDRWIVVDNVGKRHLARNHVKFISKDLWERMPDTLKARLEYPQEVKPGNFTTIDVFVDKDADLTNFREVVWKSDFFDKEFSIFTNYEKTLSIADDKNEPLPQPPRPGNFTDEDYLRTRDEVLSGRPSKWEEMEKEREEKMLRDGGFDPNLDDAIIIR